jgi:hypothetical protein
VLLCTGHGSAAAVWLFAMPKGFPVSHPRFWANVVIPLCLIVVAVAAIAAFRSNASRALGRWCAVPAFLWIGILATGLLLFPGSASPFLVFTLMTVIGLFGYSAWVLLGVDRRSAAVVGVALPALLGGSLVAVAQRGANPATTPLANAMPPLDGLRRAHSDVQLNDTSTFQVDSASIISRRDGVTVYIAPLLTFTSRSPDRCWTIFSPQHESMICDGIAPASDGIGAWYSGREQGFVGIRPVDVGLQITAYRELSQPVYSHLNSYLEIYITGVKDPRITFSAGSHKPIEIEASDYPVGRPARFAYVTDDGLFRVVEATSGEKGPYHELDAGPLPAGQPLALSISSGDSTHCVFELHDWSAQASRQLSPTAGWGVPENAIQFVQTTGGGVFIYATLASTSVGRGWDSVGHAPGVYRNLMDFAWVGEGSDKESESKD